MGEDTKLNTNRKRMSQIILQMNNENVKVKITQLGPTVCNPMDYTVHGILLARILEWVAFPISRGFSQPRDGTQVSRIAGGFQPGAGLCGFAF